MLDKSEIHEDHHQSYNILVNIDRAILPAFVLKHPDIYHIKTLVQFTPSQSPKYKNLKKQKKNYTIYGLVILKM